MGPQFTLTPEGRRLAFFRLEGQDPGVVFLGGFRSDMTGTKAMFLEDWARRRGRAFLRFDYSGHGASGGAFEDGCIGDWAADAAAMMTLVQRPQVVVGSSMGGWIALLLARSMPERVAGLVGIAVAADFTEGLEAGLTPAERDALARDGQFLRSSPYAQEPYIFTRRLIEDGRLQTVLGAPLALRMPVRLLQGTADDEVPVETALRIVSHVQADDLMFTLVKGADHRFSTPACLTLIARAVEEVSGYA